MRLFDTRETGRRSNNGNEAGPTTHPALLPFCFDTCTIYCSQAWQFSVVVELIIKGKGKEGKKKEKKGEKKNAKEKRKGRGGRKKEEEIQPADRDRPTHSSYSTSPFLT
jgi:hypothetical protein